MQVLFEREKRSIDEMAALEKNTSELGEVDQDFAKSLVEGAISMEEELKAAILKHAPEWTLEKMDPIARPVLMIGAYELLYADDAPPAVVMNEAIDIAKEYGTDETGKFVNGVLNSMAKNG